jgi:hypothetical protein
VSENNNEAYRSHRFYFEFRNEGESLHNFQRKLADMHKEYLESQIIKRDEGRDFNIILASRGINFTEGTEKIKIQSGYILPKNGKIALRIRDQYAGTIKNMIDTLVIMDELIRTKYPVEFQERKIKIEQLELFDQGKAA